MYPAISIMNFVGMPCLIQNVSNNKTLFLFIMSLFSWNVDWFLSLFCFFFSFMTLTFL